MASVMIEVDLPPGVEITAYERHQDGHGFEVRWPLPGRCRCERCGHEDRAQIEYKTSPQAVRDLDVWGQPSFWIYQAPFHRCARCDHRQHIIPAWIRAAHHPVAASRQICSQLHPAPLSPCRVAINVTTQDTAAGRFAVPLPYGAGRGDSRRTRSSGSSGWYFSAAR